MKIEPSCIYVAPPSYHMIVAGDYLFFNRWQSKTLCKTFN
jgi:chemotaxis response regulator CheB